MATRIRIEVIETDHTGRTMNAKVTERWIVFPPHSSIPGYPANPGDETDHEWQAYEDDGAGNGDAVTDGNSRSLASVLSLLAETITNRYF